MAAGLMKQWASQLYLLLKCEQRQQQFWVFQKHECCHLVEQNFDD